MAEDSKKEDLTKEELKRKELEEKANASVDWLNKEDNVDPQKADEADNLFNQFWENYGGEPAPKEDDNSQSSSANTKGSSGGSVAKEAAAPPANNSESLDDLQWLFEDNNQAKKNDTPAPQAAEQLPEVINSAEVMQPPAENNEVVKSSKSKVTKKNILKRKEKESQQPDSSFANGGDTLKKNMLTIMLAIIVGAMMSGILGTYLLLKKTRSCYGATIVVASIHTGDMLLVDSKDRYRGKDIIKKGYADNRVAYLMYQLLKPGDVAIDVGSNYGYYTTYMSRIVGNRGHVYSIEADHHIYTLLKRSIMLNEIQNVTLMNNLVFSSNATVKIDYNNNHRHNPKVNIVLNNSRDDLLSEQAFSLDVLLKNKKDISLIHINTRGNEANVIKGAMNILMHSPTIKILTTWDPKAAKENINLSKFVNQVMNSGFHFWAMNYEERKIVKLKTVNDVLKSNHYYLIIAKKI